MLNFDRQKPDAKPPGKIPLKPALYDAPDSSARSTSSTAARPMTGAPGPVPSLHDSVAATSTRTPAPAAPPAATVAAAGAAEDAGSKLSVGVNIRLKGVEISNCDALVIEGQVEATVHSKSMQIDKPGTLTGNAIIDIAEIHGEFSGELTARTRLVVHGTGRVSGTIRYGKLIVAEGGELTGDVKRLDGTEDQAQGALPVGRDSRVF
jgi:cytoskeletal protein CcmA (bactofilin family)